MVIGDLLGDVGPGAVAELVMPEGDWRPFGFSQDDSFSISTRSHQSTCHARSAKGGAQDFPPPSLSKMSRISWADLAVARRSRTERSLRNFAMAASVRRWV